MSFQMIEYKKVGAPFKYMPDQLALKVQEYKEWANNQTFEKVVFDPKTGEQKSIFLKSPLTIQQFCLYIGISYKQFNELKNNNNDSINGDYSNEIRAQLSDILTHVHEYIQQNQLSGAILNEYNPNIVSRLNGLTDTVNINQQISVNALPVHIGNNVIDLTDSEFEVVNNNDTDMLTELI